MLRINFILLIIAAFTASVKSQTFSAGLSYGYSQYRGDLVQDKQGVFQNLRSMKGGYASFNINQRFNFFASYFSTSLSAYDAESENPGHQNRNLHFRSPLKEFSAGFEVYPVAFFTKSNFFLKPYFKTGFAIFRFNPQAQYKGKWYDLQPMRTEGQGMPNSGLKPYSLIDIAYPFGAGLKIDIIRSVSMKFELCPRKTFTDYLDDVSSHYYDLDAIRNYSSDIAAKLAYNAVDWNLENTAPPVNGMIRGNKNNKDWYIIQQFTLTFNFGKKPIKGMPYQLLEMPLHAAEDLKIK